MVKLSRRRLPNSSGLYRSIIKKVIIVATKLRDTRWVNWDKNCFEEVKLEASKDEDYKQAMKRLEKEEENGPETFSQEDEVLYQRMGLWIPCGLRTSILGREYDSKVAGHMGEDKIAE
jgi:hypothetical protein